MNDTEFLEAMQNELEEQPDIDHCYVILGYGNIANMSDRYWYSAYNYRHDPSYSSSITWANIGNEGTQEIAKGCYRSFLFKDINQLTQFLERFNESILVKSINPQIIRLEKSTFVLTAKRAIKLER